MSGGGILFTSSPESLFIAPPQQLFTECVYLMAIDDNIVEANETGSVLIDRASLMFNDIAGNPDQLEINITDNNGMVPLCFTTLQLVKQDV